VWGVLAGGLFFTGILGAFLLTVTGHTARLQAVNAELEKEIAERKAAQEELTKFAVIVESSEDAIVGTTWGGIIVTWNKGAEIVYGYSAEEVKGRSISILYPPDRPNELLRLRQQLESGEHVAQYETVRMRKDGTRVPISLTLSLMKDATGKIVGVASIGSDITARTEAETKLQRQREAVAQRLHDSVLQSLTAVGLHLELAQGTLTLDANRAKVHLETIERVLEQEQRDLRAFVRELKGLGIARHRESSSKIAAFEDAVKRLEAQWRVRVELEIEQGENWIPNAIVEDLIYVIREGTANAVRHGHASMVAIQIGPKDENLIMRLMDNGGGFPFQYDEAALATNRVGPAMLRSRIASLGGLLSIRSADSGACLEIILPLSRPGASHADHPGSLG
jgi:PAS domain S-box-containing protein